MSRLEIREKLVTEPPAVWLHPSWLCFIFSFLECSSLNNFPIFVADGFAAIEHLEAANLFRIPVKILSLDLRKRYAVRRG